MTEAEWLSCSDSSRLLQYAWNKVSDRKLRLFASACCRRMKATLPDGGGLALRIAERFADGLASAAELAGMEEWTGGRALRALGTAASVWGADWACTWSQGWAAADGAARASAAEGQFQGQADLFREIVGNPFRPPNMPTDWPPTVVALAEAIYQGEDCHFALHDALLEIGLPELAEHFAVGPHPKGCWVTDLILGKS
jgi:hypothetical protein